MPLYSARTRTSDEDSGGSGSSRISPRPGAAIQNALARSDGIRTFWCVRASRYNPVWRTAVLSDLYVIKAGGIFAAIMAIAMRARRAHHPFARFGSANVVTTVRALLV